MTYIPPNASGTYANRPTAGQTGRIYYCTDTPLIFFDNGTTWLPYGTVSPFTAPPAAAGFTVYNAGGRTTTLSDSLGGLKMSYTDGTTGYDCRVAVKSIAAAPYTYTGFFLPEVFADTQLFGLALRQSSDGKIETFEMSSSTTMTSISFNYHNASASNTSTSPTYTQNAAGGVGMSMPFEMGRGIWMQIQDDNTNRLYRTSTDGINWKTLRSVVRTSYLTPDQIGVMVFNSTAGQAAQTIWIPSLG